MTIETFLENRAKFPLEELQRHTGQWVAFTADGTRLVASAVDLVALNERLRSAGANPEDYVVECVPNQDVIIHGSEMD